MRPDDQTAARFSAVVVSLEHGRGVIHAQPGSRFFDHSALKIFAMISSNGQFVVKLPKTRVDALDAAGAGHRFEGSGMRPMKEWLVVHSESDEEWLQLAREALDFVGT